MKSNRFVLMGLSLVLISQATFSETHGKGTPQGRPIQESPSEENTVQFLLGKLKKYGNSSSNHSVVIPGVRESLFSSDHYVEFGYDKERGMAMYKDLWSDRYFIFDVRGSTRSMFEFHDLLQGRAYGVFLRELDPARVTIKRDEVGSNGKRPTYDVCLGCALEKKCVHGTSIGLEAVNTDHRWPSDDEKHAFAVATQPMWTAALDPAELEEASSYDDSLCIFVQADQDTDADSIAKTQAEKIAAAFRHLITLRGGKKAKELF